VAFVFYARFHIYYETARVFFDDIRPSDGSGAQELFLEHNPFAAVRGGFLSAQTIVWKTDVLIFCN
jgi:hypothetical protein